MRPIRRNDMAPRIEMTPLVDVILLLLVFFIYSVTMMVRADVLPVKLTALGSGQYAGGAAMEVITVDRLGNTYFNAKPITPERLDAQLRDLGQRPDHPPLYLAMEEAGSTDRGPLLLKLIEKVRAAGIVNFVLVGQPGPTTRK